jgi:hypothetical protein
LRIARKRVREDFRSCQTKLERETPPGEGGILTDVRRRPYSVVLLDEMENVHPVSRTAFPRP